MSGQSRYRRQWRFYETSGGARPVEDFIDSLPREDASKLVAAMADVAADGLPVARHLRGDIYEVREDGRDQSYRVLFAPEGRYGQILLALEAFSKKTQRTPPAKINLAEARLRDWRERGEKLRAERARHD
jgi:phage-related protein